jgi:hypothetical protein
MIFLAALDPKFVITFFLSREMRSRRVMTAKILTPIYDTFIVGNRIFMNEKNEKDILRSFFLATTK